MSEEVLAAAGDLAYWRRRAELAEADAATMRQALAYYTTATIVASWGYEELRDNGDVARAALGLGEHAPTCGWPNDAEQCTCGLEDGIATAIADHPGAALLDKLAAVQAVVEAARSAVAGPDSANYQQLSDAIDAYDQARRSDP